MRGVDRRLAGVAPRLNAASLRCIVIQRDPARSHRVRVVGNSQEMECTVRESSRRGYSPGADGGCSGNFDGADSITGLDGAPAFRPFTAEEGRPRGSDASTICRERIGSGTKQDIRRLDLAPGMNDVHSDRCHGSFRLRNGRAPVPVGWVRNLGSSGILGWNPREFMGGS